jgi:hypothetical protein
VIRNALHVPSMKNNLLPPFVLREAGIRVRDTPEIQEVSDPTVDDHSIYFPETGFRIPLSLWGTFSYFSTSKLTAEFMKGPEEVYLLTPSKSNPSHCDAYASNEENMLDWEGNMIKKQDRGQILLSEVHEDTALAASVQISSIESRMINNIFQRNDDVSPEEKVHPCWKPIPRAADEVSSVLAGISPILDDQALYERLQARLDLGRFQVSIGSTNALGSEFLVDDKDSAAHDTTDSDSDEEDDEQVLDDLFESVTNGDIDLDAIMVSAAHAGKSKGIDAAHLSKIW